MRNPNGPERPRDPNEPTPAASRIPTSNAIPRTNPSVIETERTRASRTSKGEGVGAEVIDPRTLEPLDLETMVSSVRRTNRLAVVHEVGSSAAGAASAI
jgi:hypothetical protein